MSISNLGFTRPTTLAQLDTNKPITQYNAKDVGNVATGSVAALAGGGAIGYVGMRVGNSAGKLGGVLAHIVTTNRKFDFKNAQHLKFAGRFGTVVSLISLTAGAIYGLTEGWKLGSNVFK
jgi:hypothetical protein